jgi:hypothetical protein
MAHPDDVAQVAHALRTRIRRQYPEQDDEPGSAYAMALAELIAEALSGPEMMQRHVEINIGLRRQRCAFSLNRRPGGNRR